MPNIKHKLFKISIINDDKKDFDEKVLKTINEFLTDSNNVYMNHSVTVLTSDNFEFGQFKTTCTHIVVSLIYNDLAETSLDLKTASNKTKALVHKQIKDEANIPEPITDTEFDKEQKEFIEKGNRLIVPSIKLS